MIIVLTFMVLVFFLVDVSRAEEYETAYILARPNKYVNVRPKPGLKYKTQGWLMCGDKIYLDGKKRNGFLHVVDLPAEDPNGWVYEGYIVYEEPKRIDWDYLVVSNGRLAARNCIGGKVNKWLKPFTEVHVYYEADGWAVTDYGFVKFEYLEYIGE